MQSNLNCLDSKVTPQQNFILTAPYTATEVTTALFQLHPNPMKAPGKDGFSVAFTIVGLLSKMISLETVLPF
ncbi:unnamed protein product [Rhodiola kirilowii]